MIVMHCMVINHANILVNHQLNPFANSCEIDLPNLIVRRHCFDHTTPRLRKNCANFFLSELREISTNFGNFGGKMAKRLQLHEVHSFSTSPNSRHHITVLNADVPNCYTTLKVVIFSKLSSDLSSIQ